MREQPRISENHLRTCLQDQYGLVPLTLQFLPLGLDSNAGVYRVESEEGTTYLLKVRPGSLYESSCLVPRYLNDQGITAIVAPLRTRSNTLWARLEGWTAILYPFIDGETSWTGMTDEQWKEVGTIFQRIHRVRLPSRGFESLRKETFDPTEYARWIQEFETRHMDARDGGSASARALRSSWVTHQSTIHTTVTSLEKLAEVLRGRTLPYVVCHADLHPANLLRDRVGRVFVLDWDEVMLAPKERDFIFVRGPQAAAFFQGYGQTEIDWTALTYYLWERIVQDVIECTKNVCFRDDWSEEARTEEARLFQETLAEEGSDIAAVYAAAAHLPSDLMVHPRKSL